MDELTYAKENLKKAFKETSLFVNFESFVKWLDKKLTKKSKFHCQCEIEGESKCKTQCEHCEEYYKDINK